MSKILAIDIGNTRAKWGVHDGQAWIEQGAVETVQLAAFADQLSATLNLNLINKIWISSVVDKNITLNFMQQLSFMHAELNLVEPSARKCGVINHYDIAEQLGTDRWCALIAARHIHKGHAIVVMAGTAMTVDALTADGHFLGGMIVPGLSLMQDALRKRTANLRPEVGDFKAFPTQTQDAIHSGIISASLGAITHARNAMHAAGNLDPVCIIGGGGAAWLAPHIAPPLKQIDNLVLEGLLRIAQSESAGSK